LLLEPYEKEHDHLDGTDSGEPWLDRMFIQAELADWYLTRAEELQEEVRCHDRLLPKDSARLALLRALRRSTAESSEAGVMLYVPCLGCEPSLVPAQIP
jgi:hypothetical protein